MKDDKLQPIVNQIEEKISNSALDSIKAVDEKIVKAAISNMKPAKRDCTFDVTSDMYQNAPDIFYNYLSKVLQQSLVHGNLPHVVLLCTLMPLIKDNLGDITKSENYRAIAGSCLILKVLDTVILNSEGSKLSTDPLQFAYKANTGTTACTWTVTAVIDYFTRNGKPLFGAAMDMSKAFDMVKWSELFRTLLKRGVEPIFLRLLIHIYTNQEYTVKWGQHIANYFSIKNGVRQGGVSSGIFFIVYIDKLLDILRRSGFGCTLHGTFYGAMIYADDIFLLSASRTGLQEMINISHRYVSKLNLKFGTNVNPNKSKTKCIIFSRKKIKEQVKAVSLNGHVLPWVDHVNHLGHTLQSNNSMSIDINLKRGAFISKVNSILQEFYYATPEVKLKFVHTYACNIYGSNIWNLFSNESHRLYTSYNVAVRNIFNLPRTTHRYLLESISDAHHLYVMLLSRYVTFVKMLLENDAFEVRFLSEMCLRKQWTVLGKSITKIAELCDMETSPMDLNASIVKKRLKYASIPSEETWRIGIIKDMLDIMNYSTSTPGLTDHEVSEILTVACSS